MTRSFVDPNSPPLTLRDLPPSTPEEIRLLARLAGLNLSAPLLDELCKSYPAFEAMVRRLPRARARFDEPALHVVPANRVAGLEDKG